LLCEGSDRDFDKPQSVSTHERQIARCVAFRRTATEGDEGRSKMNEMMGSGMMWGMGVAGIIGIVVVVLLIAALIKYLFFR
jgi:hypothetical protein